MFYYLMLCTKLIFVSEDWCCIKGHSGSHSYMQESNLGP